MNKQVTVALLIIVTVAGLTYISMLVTFPAREVQRWSACLGQRLDECQVPSGYLSVDFPCLTWLDCSTDPAGVSYASATLIGRTGAPFATFTYAVLALDSKKRVLRVEVKHHYKIF